jgi:hypothetical protein
MAGGQSSCLAKNQWRSGADGLDQGKELREEGDGISGKFSPALEREEAAGFWWRRWTADREEGRLGLHCPVVLQQFSNNMKGWNWCRSMSWFPWWRRFAPRGLLSGETGSPPNGRALRQCSELRVVTALCARKNGGDWREDAGAQARLL